MQASSTVDHSETPLVDFHHSRFMRLCMRVCLIGFCFLDAFCILFSIYIVFFDAEKSLPYPVQTAVFFVSFWTFWVLLGIWNVLHTERNRLRLFKSHLFHQGVSRSRTIEWKDVTRIWWGRFGQSIVIESATTRITLELGRGSKDQQDWLVNYFRRYFSKKTQKNYQVFRATRMLHILPSCDPPKIQWVKAISFNSLFLAAILGMGFGYWTGNGLAIVSGVGALVLVMLIGFTIGFFERRRMVARFGSD